MLPGGLLDYCPDAAARLNWAKMSTKPGIPIRVRGKLIRDQSGAQRLEPYDQLELVAEIAAALLGFIAIFLALSRTDGRFSESDRHFIQALVLSSSLAIILAITPRAIGLYELDKSVWFIASLLALSLGSLAMLLQARLQLGMRREEAAKIHWLWHIGAWALAVTSAICFGLALIDSSRIIALYVSGVSVLVPLCLWVFIGVVFRRFF